MACPENEAALVDRAAGTLDAAGAADLDRHVATCAACRAELESLRGTLQAVRLPSVSDRETRALSGMTERTVHEWRRLEARRAWRSPVAGILAAAAAAALVIVPIVKRPVAAPSRSPVAAAVPSDAASALEAWALADPLSDLAAADPSSADESDDSAALDSDWFPSSGE